MSQRIARASRRRQESGFTLIELLVVIIILGVLASVVVFSVQGAGDKGRANAIKADEKTIRTAEEAYFAQNGTYGTAQDLVDGGFLNGLPTYNRVFLNTEFGPGNNTGYDIYPDPESSGSPPAALPPLGCTPNVSGSWCSAGPATTGSNTTREPHGIVLLNDGRVFAMKRPQSSLAFGQIFNPALGGTGTWTPVPPAVPATLGPTVITCNAINTPLVATGSTIPGCVPPAVGPGTLRTMTVLKGGPGLCGDNCGKVLVKFSIIRQGGSCGSVPNASLRNEVYQLYDPVAKPARTVSDLSTTTSSRIVTSATADFLTMGIGTVVIGPGIPVNSSITEVTNATTALLNVNATATASNVSVTMGAPGGTWKVVGTSAPCPPNFPSPPPAIPLPTGPNETYGRHGGMSMVQLLRTPCGSYCGKVLIVGSSGEDNYIWHGTPAQPEFFDPITATFSRPLPIGAYTESGCTTGSDGYPMCQGTTLTALRDGRALMISRTNAQVFDPVAGRFVDVGAPPFQYNQSGRDGSTALMGDDRVLATSNPLTPTSLWAPSNAMAFDPATNQWNNPVTNPVPSCGRPDLGSEPQCLILAALPDGKVLGAAKDPQTTGFEGTSLATGIYDPATNTWTPVTGQVPGNRPSTRYAVLLSEMKPGSCGNLCGKVMGTGIAFGVPPAVDFYTP